jgi:hypothetical protein
MRRTIFKRAFVAGLFRDALAAAPAFEGADPVSAASKAWAVRDRLAFIPPARAVLAQGRSKPAISLRLARALFENRLVDEALEALLAPPDAPELAPERLGLIASLWLELGAVRRAASALKAAQAAGWRETETAALLERLIDIRLNSRKLGDWADTESLIWRSLDLSLDDAAAALLRTFLERQGKSSAGELEPILSAALCIFRTASPTASVPLLAALADLCEVLGRGAALRATLALARGAEPRRLSPPEATEKHPDPNLLTCFAQACAASGAWRAAAERFVVNRKAKDLGSENIIELARCVGRDLLQTKPIALRQAGPRKVFDLFPFNGEVTLLELKLEEMGPWVDHFVIVEAAQTFTGLPKPLLLPERLAELGPWGEKIIHVPLGAFPDHLTSPWAREFHQRDSAAQALSGLAGPEDLVIISDVDEIVRRPRPDHPALQLLAGAELRTYAYFFNCEVLTERPKVKSVFARAKLLADNGSSYLRLGGSRYLRQSVIENAGWHFTGVAEPADLERKARSFSHVEWSHLDRSYFETFTRRLREGGLGEHYARRELDDSFPASLLRRRDDLARLLL